jgi:hypothetical protein
MVQLILFVVILVLFLSSIKIVPPAHYGLVIRLGKRTGRKLKEGLNFVIPFLDQIDLFSAKMESYEMDGKDIIKIQTADKLDVLINGSFQFIPSFDNLFKYFEVEEKALKEGMVNNVQANMRNIGGNKTSDQLREMGEELGMLVNCIFRLSRPPHLYVDADHTKSKWSIDRPSFNAYLDTLDDAELPAKLNNKKSKLNTHEWKMPDWKTDSTTGNLVKFDILEFYKENISRINLMLQFEDYLDEESEIEKRYAIEALSFEIGKFNYTPETVQAMEAQKQAELEIQGINAKKEAKILYSKELIDELGVSPDNALDEASASMGDSKKTSVKGGNTLNLNNL